jgi:FkbH-like protein
MVKSDKPEFDDILAAGSLAELRSEVSARRLSMTLPQVQRLTVRAEALAPGAPALRVAVVHTYTSDLLDPWVAMAGAIQGLKVEMHHAPYGLALQEARADSALVSHRPDLTLLMLRREDLHPDLARPVVSLDSEMQARLRAESLANLRSIVERFRAEKVGHLVLTILPSLVGPALGSFDAQSDRSEARWWAALKADIGNWMRERVSASLFLDLDDVLDQVGRDEFFNLRFWYTARFPFSGKAAQEFARRVINVGVVLKMPRAKVLVLDADNTLWGGIIGEDGIDGIALGPEYPGVAYADFQRRILDFQQRGLILALCSKNNAADVDQILREHPHQVLRDEHFAARRVNWLPKAENLASLAKELNVGLDSFVFADDSDHECAAVRHMLPQVEVIQVPARPVDVPTCLDRVARLEILALTSEDLAKTELYAQERRRRDLNEEVGRSGGSIRDYLLKLDMRMRVRLNAASHIARLSQLTQKTNQFNLTTRRYDEQEIRAFIADERWVVADFSLADSFGDSGIVGLALLRRSSTCEAELDNFLMSCRVIGREAEAAFLQAVLRWMAGQGTTLVLADFRPTAKNEIARSFLAEQGFDLGADGRYRRDLVARPPEPEERFPIAIGLDDDRDAPTQEAGRDPERHATSEP